MSELSSLILAAFESEIIKKIVFSKPTGTGALKLVAKQVLHRGRRHLWCEYSQKGDTVSQKIVREGELADYIDAEALNFAQINIYTALGEAERKLGKRGEVLLGADKLLRKIRLDGEGAAIALGKINNEKKRILSGNEEFLRILGISDKDGRVHDKRQPKFRQINKFLEYVEEIYPSLSADGELYVLDLCSGKSYLSFAVYYYLTVKRGREVRMTGIDLKEDVIAFCSEKAASLGWSGLSFIADDVKNTPRDRAPDLVISLHACDVATDIVLDVSASLGARVILSTPCCQRELSSLLNCEQLRFVTKYPKLKMALASTLTDALRLERLSALGYDVSATELVDPEDTPKNTLIRAVRNDGKAKKAAHERESYQKTLGFLLGEGKDKYIGRLEDDD